MRNQLRLEAAFVQVPIGLEGDHEGVIDVIEQRAIYFGGAKGTEIKYEPIPESYIDKVRMSFIAPSSYLASAYLIAV